MTPISDSLICNPNNIILDQVWIKFEVDRLGFWSAKWKQEYYKTYKLRIIKISFFDLAFSIINKIIQLQLFYLLPQASYPNSD